MKARVNKLSEGIAYILQGGFGIAKLICVVLLIFAGCNSNTESTVVFVQPRAIVLVEPDEFDPDRWPVGEYSLLSATLMDDILAVTIRCPNHPSDEIELVAWNYFLESHPVQAHAYLSFSRGTMPMPGSVRELAFDLTPLRDAYREFYRDTSGVIDLHLRYLEPSRARVRYAF